MMREQVSRPDQDAPDNARHSTAVGGAKDRISSPSPVLIPVRVTRRAELREWMRAVLMARELVE